MNSTPSPAAVEPDNVVAVAADQRLKHAYQKIVSADEQLARVTEQLSKLERDAGRKSSPLPRRRRSRGGPALRGLIGLLLAGCIGSAAFIYQSSSGGATKLMIARWVSPVLASSVPVERPGPEAPPAPVMIAAADATVVPASSAASVAAPEAAPTAAPLPPELAQQLQTITHDIASLGQKIEQLRAAQEQLVIQMASNNARAIWEFKAGQEQIMRLMAKASEPNARPKTSSVSPPPTSTHVSPQARSATRSAQDQ